MPKTTVFDFFGDLKSVWTASSVSKYWIMVMHGLARASGAALLGMRACAQYYPLATVAHNTVMLFLPLLLNALYVF